ncbi:homoserine kinase [Gracilibacillus boraciitolerans JCM 21714]|uniref:Homoserine kinase n=1 Tax=Gracilibacillus boraciitolerans JCM 21714 TaxID=1298598 RepID=W4VLA9_9BACI|nr:homoserine kinase [Gracilibacillus boraciitolerans]GAE93992.1 homoserine kinase [Gracilibacillus boraciitolerans JCM 21714]
MSWSIKVPSSTSNLGAGFDSIGLALNLYLELDVTVSKEWEFIAKSECLEGIPAGKNNLVYEIVEKVASQYGKVNDIPSCRVEMTSNIPLARGLGSSATAIIAGMELANVLLDLQLSQDEKLQIATEIEGHPDNVAPPSLLGGCVVGHYDGKVSYTQIPVTGVTFVAVIPSFELKTKDARAVLPKSFSFKESVQASSVANLSVAAISKGEWNLLGEMMQKDYFHQPYRKSLIPHYDELYDYLNEDAYGVFLSGAGPTIIALVADHLVDETVKQWKQAYPAYQWLPLEVENNGSSVQKTMEELS